MQKVAARKASELAASEKRFVERLLNRPLSEDDEIGVFLLPAVASDGSDREQAWARLESVLDRLAAKVDRASSDDFEAVFDDALEHARWGA